MYRYTHKPMPKHIYREMYTMDEQTSQLSIYIYIYTYTYTYTYTNIVVYANNISHVFICAYLYKYKLVLLYFESISLRL